MCVCHRKGRNVNYSRLLKMAYRKGHEGRPGWAIAIVPEPALLDSLKAIPPADRSYDEETKEWWFSLSREADLIRIFPTFEAYLKQWELPL